MRVMKSIPGLEAPKEFERPYPAIRPHSIVPFCKGSSKEPAQDVPQDSDTRPSNDATISSICLRTGHLLSHRIHATPSDIQA
jgi:hypothetical protein